ncbi:hypothetical protein HETIRDRAFT_442316 [Heterobasidion irregulare TC 32-1]|uniref:Uncharacterized protein n=1 Tax=Heterobasidion irregulare (strain TC 32-1) TaxID=747525 RepID=W4JSU0_HETIT|nr:uncharacterized protein HETIRDRAFT_442316 [Heterobasidion irregulare TC 32-1]ETW75931.1 hypothetical protein HETIRDRAFT_442316 [Heterobasidion irregulare TC 32-1]
MEESRSFVEDQVSAENYHQKGTTTAHGWSDHQTEDPRVLGDQMRTKGRHCLSTDTISIPISGELSSPPAAHTIEACHRTPIPIVQRTSPTSAQKAGALIIVILRGPRTGRGSSVSTRIRV